MSGLTRNKSFIGKGTIYVCEKASDGGFLTLGNCSELSLAISEEKQEQADYQNAGGGVIASVSRIGSVTASVTALSLSANNVGLALRGLINTHASAVIVDETHTAYTGAFVPFEHLPDTAEAITVTNSAGDTTYTVDVDYAIRNAGIEIIEGSTITNATEIKIGYTSLAGYDIEGLKAASKKYEVVFDGLNEADSGRPVLVKMHNVQFNPTQALALISEDFGNLPMTFDLLKDETITGSGESQYFKMQVTE